MAFHFSQITLFSTFQSLSYALYMEVHIRLDMSDQQRVLIVGHNRHICYYSLYSIPFVKSTAELIRTAATIKISLIFVKFETVLDLEAFRVSTF